MTDMLGNCSYLWPGMRLIFSLDSVTVFLFGREGMLATASLYRANAAIFSVQVRLTRRFIQPSLLVE